MSPRTDLTRRWRPTAWSVAVVLPYVGLKVAWLTGHPLGQRDPGLFSTAPYPQANLVTLLLDAIVVVVVWLWGQPTLPRTAEAVLAVMMWLGGGLLLPVVVGVPVILPAAVADGVGQAPDPLRGWVYLVVYASLIGQAVVVHLAFSGYLRHRPAAAGLGRTAGVGGRVAATSAPWCSALTWGLLAAGSAAGIAAAVVDATTMLSLMEGRPDTAVARVTAAVHSVIALATVAAMLRLLIGPARRSAPPRWVLPVAWFGTATMLTWGSYRAVLQIWTGPAAPGLGSLLLCPAAGLLLALAAAVHGTKPGPTTPAGSPGSRSAGQIDRGIRARTA